MVAHIARIIMAGRRESIMVRQCAVQENVWRKMGIYIVLRIPEEGSSKTIAHYGLVLASAWYIMETRTVPKSPRADALFIKVLSNARVAGFGKSLREQCAVREL
ncbi:hypothetical protein BTA51_22400 [Hahella sp. CCB-MM4]|nr:hypothetical protein BTA51_22400 [Hahella sp. CCB-MM4]